MSEFADVLEAAMGVSPEELTGCAAESTEFAVPVRRLSLLPW